MLQDRKDVALEQICSYSQVVLPVCMMSDVVLSWQTMENGVPGAVLHCLAANSVMNLSGSCVHHILQFCCFKFVLSLRAMSAKLKLKLKAKFRRRKHRTTSGTRCWNCSPCKETVHYYNIN